MKTIRWIVGELAIPIAVFSGAIVAMMLAAYIVPVIAHVTVWLGKEGAEFGRDLTGVTL